MIVTKSYGRYRVDAQMYVKRTEGIERIGTCAGLPLVRPNGVVSKVGVTLCDKPGTVCNEVAYVKFSSIHSDARRVRESDANEITAIKSEIADAQARLKAAIDKAWAKGNKIAKWELDVESGTIIE